NDPAQEAQTPPSDPAPALGDDGGPTGTVSVETSRPKPRWKLWAIGLESGNRWHLFKKVEGEWRQQGIVRGISKGRQAKLLEGFAEGGGCLTKVVALKIERPNYSAGETDKLMGKIKPEMSHLRGIIRVAIEVTDTKQDPLPYDEDQKGWRAEIEIGYAVQEDREHLGGEHRLRFKTHEQLTSDEVADPCPSLARFVFPTLMPGLRLGASRKFPKNGSFTRSCLVAAYVEHIDADSLTRCRSAPILTDSQPYLLRVVEMMIDNGKRESHATSHCV